MQKGSRKVCSVEEARRIARDHLETPLPKRWLHVQAVAAKAEKIGAILFDADEARVLTVAAWLHDIGYAPDIAKTQFHPLDGARWLLEEGFEDRVTALVAHHSCAASEAELRGFEQCLSAFPNEGSNASDALLFSDMTTGPEGQNLSAQERLDEIISRYGDNHLVTQTIQSKTTSILAAIQRVESLFERKNVRTFKNGTLCEP